MCDDNTLDEYSNRAEIQDGPEDDTNDDSDRFARFVGMSDEDAVLCARGGDKLAEEYILRKYKTAVRSRGSSYYLHGGDRDDILQEGMIGLYKAMRDFKPGQSSFHTFAELCIKRQILTAVKMATRKKHGPLNSYISLNQTPYDDESQKAYIETLAEAKSLDPEVIYIDDEDASGLTLSINEMLTPLELSVLELYNQDVTYAEIAAILGKPVKSVDNALQRAKAKLGAYLRAQHKTSEER